MKGGFQSVIGHRGSGTGIHPLGGPENSLASIGWAFEHGADEVEVDVARTLDGEFVLFHDESIRPRYGRTLRVGGLTLAELREHRPDVARFVDMARAYPGRRFVIELKSYTSLEPVIDGIAGWIRGMGPDNFRFLSFSLTALLLVRKSIPGCRTGYIATCVEERWEPFVRSYHLRRCLDHGIDEISGHWWTFGGRMATEASRAGLEIGMGLIDGPRAMKKCMRTGAGRLYTNRPDWLSRQLKHIH